MNHIQVVGSHNSYHVEAPLEELEAQKELLDNYIKYRYSHPQLDIQLGDQKMRNLEYAQPLPHDRYMGRLCLTGHAGSMSWPTRRAAVMPSP